jgi:hypothetical protein
MLKANKKTWTKSVIATSTLVAAAFIGLSSAQAVPVVWDFTPVATGALGATHTYDSTPSGTSITASAFGTAGVQLYGKNDGTGEQGLGLTGNTSNPSNEITAGNFVQLDLVNLHVPPFTSVNMSFSANSSTGVDSWAVYGSNTAGSFLTANLILSGTDQNVDTLANVLGTWRYLDATALTGDVLLNHLDNNINVVPLPGAIWMFGAGLGGLSLLLRRRRNKGQLQPV